MYTYKLHIKKTKSKQLQFVFSSIVVSGVKTVTGMAVDWISKNLYWIDSEKVCTRITFLSDTVGWSLEERIHSR